MGWLSIVGAGVSALSQKAQGDREQKAANIQAAEIDQAALTSAQKLRKLATQTRGSARAALAASGVDVDTGTSQTIDEEITRDSESDYYNTILNGQRQSDAVRRSGKAAADAATYNTLSTLVSGADKAYSRWKQAGTTRAGEQ